ncbi:hypothetical protein Asppvi_010377 [Aspergillus pseudoviridinutans]|uniref:SMP-30/Gluconolactonase/LRE-like region domain-containing protein n=1 Tax=Aspergillus pseudoviridinutans TaxID=1517512 RepID=A0A9P3BHK3_9EURO|nr:uncharacterized protein Asppvi_010377 [Aspergillus pseudoviridinutans]GIJ91412.1 hypothetical protein Asppvi_010377 [Aspergillus pseudoviridinutans]
MYSHPNILWLYALITTLISPALALPTLPTTNTSSTSTVFQFTRNGTWLENLAVRPNGNILATRLDVPELWLINPSNTNTAEAGSLFYTFPNATSLLGITEIDRDVYAVVAGNFSISTVTSTPGSFVIWRIDASGTAPSASILARIPDAETLNGITRFGQNLLLITDSGKGVIWRLDMSTGLYSQALSDPTMLPAAGQPYAVGVNGVAVRGKYVYYTSTTQMLFCRVPVDSVAAATGPVEIVTSGITPDDFTLERDGTAYITTNPDNGLVKVDPKGRVRLVAGNQFTIAVGGSTAVAGSKDGSVLYVSTSGGQFSPILGKLIEPAKVVAVHL